MAMLPVTTSDVESHGCTFRPTRASCIFNVPKIQLREQLYSPDEFPSFYSSHLNIVIYGELQLLIITNLWRKLTFAILNISRHSHVQISDTKLSKLWKRVFNFIVKVQLSILSDSMHSILIILELRCLKVLNRLIKYKLVSYFKN